MTILSSRIVMLRALLMLPSVSSAGLLITNCTQKIGADFLAEAYIMDRCQLDNIDI